MLFVRSLINNIDKMDNLCEIYFKTKMVDLGDVGISLFRPSPQFPVPYPKTTNALMARLGLQVQKGSGKNVWQMFDSKEFQGIQARTEEEVKNLKIIASKIGGFATHR
jgi:hypothetical protein